MTSTRWYERVADDLELFLRDAATIPPSRRSGGVGGRARRLADSLAAPLGGSRAVRAAVGHALAFETWRSLVRPRA